MLAMNTKVLLVDERYRTSWGMLGEYLEREGFEVKACMMANRVSPKLYPCQYAIAVLDVMMPGKSGIEVLARIRADSVMPVLMLTAKGDDADRYRGA